MKRLLLAAALLLGITSAQGQNVFFPANPGDMIVKGGAGAWVGVPGGTAGCVLTSNGPAAAPTWNCALALNFGLPPIATNRVWGNVSGGQAVPSPIDVNQFLNTVGYDVLRTPPPGSMIYLEPTTATWQSLVPTNGVGFALTNQGVGKAPAWAPAGAVAPPGVAGTCLISNGISVSPTYQACIDASAFHPGGNTGLPYFTAGVVSYLTALPVSLFNSGIGASATTFWSGNATWVTAVTSVTCNGGVTIVTTSGTCLTREQVAGGGGRTYYVRADGNDVNCTGLVNAAYVSGSFPQPCAVRQAQTVIDRAYTLDTYQQNVNINIGDGTYTTAININQPLVGGGIFFITGNTVTPSNVLLNVTGPAAFVATEGARVFVTGIKFQSTGDCIQANYHSKIILFSDGTHEGYEVGACGGAGIQLSYYSAVQSNGNYRISGGGGQFIHVTNQSIYTSDVSTATIVGTPAYSNFFMGCSESSTAVFNTTWSGSATGSRAFIHQGCIVGTTGSVAVSPDAYFPGNAASNWFGDGSFNDLAARLGFTPIAVPGTPPTGTASVYADSTTKRLCNKDDAGVVSCTAVGVETAWTAYTPTITAGSGTFTSVSATGAFKQIGKTVYFRVSITITTNNTAAGRVEATLPVAANSAQGIQTLSGVNPGTPVVLTAFISPAVSTTKMLLFSAGGTYPGGDGVPLAAAGVYEVP